MRGLTLVPLLAVLFGLAPACGAQDFARLEKDLQSGDHHVRREAAFELRELGAEALPALPALIGALGDDDEQVAARAVTAIARIGPKASPAIPALIDTMDPEGRRYDEQVVYRAAYALSEIGEASVGPLREALRDRSGRRRAGAALALELIGAGASAAIPELLIALHDDGPEVRRAAAEALGVIGEPALEPLRKDLGESSEDPTATVLALGLIGRPAREASAEMLALFANDSTGDELRGTILTALGAMEVPFNEAEITIASCARR